MASSATDPAPFSAHERMIAWRYLRARRKEGFISVIAVFSFLGILLGVATLIIVMAVMNGFRSELINKILGFAGHATVYAIDRQPITDFDAITKRFKVVDGLYSANPFVEGQVMASSRFSNTGALVKGLREDDLKALPSVNNERLQGSFDGFDRSQGIAIGSRMAWKLGLGLGHMLTLISPDGPETIIGTTPRIRDYPIVAIFEIGMSEFDQSVIYMPLAEAQEYFDLGEGVTAIEVKVDDPDRVEQVVKPLQTPENQHLGIRTWKEANSTLFNALVVERNVMFIVVSLIILVAALNIISGLIMLVKDKGRDIAILRTMGATRASIQRIFFMTGAAIGVAGTIVGVIVGIVICLNAESIRRFLEQLLNTEIFPKEIFFLSQLPAEVNVTETVSVAAMSLALSFLATLYPSWRAARLDPVEALRYE